MNDLVSKQNWFQKRTKKEKILLFLIGVPVSIVILIIVIGIVVAIFQTATMTDEEMKAKDIERVRQDSVITAQKEAKQKAEEEEILKKKANSDKYAAITMTEKFVEKRLKSPSTADFCSTSEYTTNNIDVGKWTVIGWVDSQNSFGATIRTNFVVTIQYNVEADTWSMLEINTN